MRYRSYKYYFLFILILLSNIVKGQDAERKIDSLFDIAYSYGENYNLNAAILYYAKADSICEENKLFQKSIRIKFNIISSYLALTNFEKARYYLKKVRVNLPIDRKTVEWCTYYNLLGTSEINRLEYEKSLKYFDSSLIVATFLNDSIALFESYNKIALVYHYLEKNEKCIEVSNKALQYIGNDNSDRAFIYRIKGMSFMNISNYDSAITSLLSASKIYDQLGANLMKYHIEDKIIKCYLYLYRDTKEEKYLEKVVLPINKQLEWYLSDNAVNQVMNEQFFNMYADYLKYKGDFDSAIKYALKAYRISDSLNINIDRMAASQNLIELAMMKAGYSPEVASKYFDDMKNLFSKSNSESISEFQIKYETLEKEAKIKELKYQKIQDKNKRNIIILVSIIVIIILIGFLRIRQAKFKLKLELEMQEKKKIARELEYKEKELVIQIDAIQDKAKVIEQLKKEIQNMDNNKSIIQKLEQNYIDDREWDQIIHQFNMIHKNYLINIKEQITNITYSEIKLLVLIKLNYSNKSMSEILNISNEGVTKAKYRFRKKLKDIDENIFN